MPTDPRLADLLDALDAARRELAAALERVPPADRDRAPRDDAWSVAQILEHLVKVETRSMTAFERLAGGAPAREAGADPGDADRFDDGPLLDRTQRVAAPEVVRPAGDVGAAEAWSRLGAARERTQAIVRAADGRALEQATMAHPRFGPLNGYQWVAALAAHERRHALQVHEVADARAARDAR